MVIALHIGGGASCSRLSLASLKCRDINFRDHINDANVCLVFHIKSKTEHRYTNTDGFLRCDTRLAYERRCLEGMPGIEILFMTRLRSLKGLSDTRLWCGNTAFFCAVVWNPRTNLFLVELVGSKTVCARGGYYAPRACFPIILLLVSGFVQLKACSNSMKTGSQ